MEPRFAHDFSRVRVHTDSKAAESASAVNALAYTVGRYIVFGAGQYVRGTATGKRLLAHELTHTVQQERGAVLARRPRPVRQPPRSATEAGWYLRKAGSGEAADRGDSGSGETAYRQPWIVRPAVPVPQWPPCFAGPRTTARACGETA